MKIVTKRKDIAGSELQRNGSFGLISNEFIETGRRNADLRKGW